MKRIFLSMALVAISITSFGRVICDTTCHAPEDEFRNFAVVSPVGRSMVTHIEQAPRLTTLDNKTIAIYDASGKMIGRSNSHFNMHSLPSGVYMVYVQGVKGALKITRP